MGDEKQTDDGQSDLSTATESLKLEGDQKDSGDTSKSDKVKSKIAIFLAMIPKDKNTIPGILDIE